MKALFRITGHYKGEKCESQFITVLQ